jgi:anti-sigma factor RsiW
MAALARLDGEAAHLTPAEVDAHTATCGACHAAIAGFTTLHGALDRVDYERLDVELWPAIRPRLATDSSNRAAEIAALLGLTAALVAWRLAQLLLEWPVPVVNSIVPLALIVMVLRRLTGDPFAIRSSLHLRQQEGAS